MAPPSSTSNIVNNINKAEVANTDSNEKVTLQQWFSMEAKVDDLVSNVKTFDDTLKGITKLIKKIAKHFEISTSGTGVSNTRTGGANSGFAKPSQISAELAKFVGVEPKTMMSRVEVTRAISAHVKSHQLQDQADKRIISPDLELRNLFNIKDGETFTFVSIQKMLKDHFIKSPPVVKTPGDAGAPVAAAPAKA